MIKLRIVALETVEYQGEEPVSNIIDVASVMSRPRLAPCDVAVISHLFVVLVDWLLAYGNVWNSQSLLGRLLSSPCLGSLSFVQRNRQLRRTTR